MVRAHVGTGQRAKAAIGSRRQLLSCLGVPSQGYISSQRQLQGSCHMQRRPLLDELTLPGVSRCGLSVPCPDRVTPMRVASSMWSWAEGHPTSLPSQNSSSQHRQHSAQPAATMPASSSHSSGPEAAAHWVAGGLRQLWQHVWPPAAPTMLKVENEVSNRAAAEQQHAGWSCRLTHAFSFVQRFRCCRCICTCPCVIREACRFQLQT